MFIYTFLIPQFIHNPDPDLPPEAAQGEEGARGDRGGHPDRIRLRRTLWQEDEASTPGRVLVHITEGK